MVIITVSPVRPAGADECVGVRHTDTHRLDRLGAPVGEEDGFGRSKFEGNATGKINAAVNIEADETLRPDEGRAHGEIDRNVVPTDVLGTGLHAILATGQTPEIDHRQYREPLQRRGRKVKLDLNAVGAGRDAIDADQAEGLRTRLQCDVTNRVGLVDRRADEQAEAQIVDDEAGRAGVHLCGNDAPVRIAIDEAIVVGAGR